MSDSVSSSTAMSIAATALRAQEARMRIIAENMANANSTSKEPGGDPYRRQVPVFEPMTIEGGARGVKMARVQPDKTPFKTEYDPSNPSADATARLKTVQDRMGVLKTAVAAAAQYRTPPNQGLIGWSSPSPAIDATGVWALFGNGVVAAHGLDGALKWSRWLGPPPERMLGYDSGTSASPLRVDDLLVVPFRNLTALDAATGAVRWTDKRPWPHYGPAAVTKVGGVSMLLLPDGRILRARDGVELAKDLADVWYIAPVVAGDVVIYLEARSGAEVIQSGGVTMKAYRLAAAPGGSVTTTPLWTTKIPAKDPFYGQPVASLGYAYLATSTAELWTVNLTSGAVTATRKVAGLTNDTVYAGPMVAGGHLYVGNDSGQTAVLSIGATPELLRVNALEAMRASPAFVDGRVYLRSANALYAFQ